MVMRLRCAMKSDVLQLEGKVEVDETFVGGKARNMHAKDRKAAALTGIKGKVAVIGAISRKGMIVAKVIENTDTRTLDDFVHETVSKNVRLIATDEHSGYRHLGRDMNHKVVRHSAGEHVVGTTHTNTIEGFWSLFKRGTIVSVNQVRKQDVPRYYTQLASRANNLRHPTPLTQ